MICCGVGDLKVLQFGTGHMQVTISWILHKMIKMLWTFSTNLYCSWQTSSLVLNYSTSIVLQAPFLLDEHHKSWHNHRVTHVTRNGVSPYLPCREISKGEQMRESEYQDKTPDQPQFTYKLKNYVLSLICHSSLFYIDVITVAVVIVW